MDRRGGRKSKAGREEHRCLTSSATQSIGAGWDKNESSLLQENNCVSMLAVVEKRDANDIS